MKQKKRKVLVSGFEPWAEFKQNPSQQVAEHFPEHVILPVDFQGSSAALFAEFAKFKPDVLLMLGLKASAEKILVEKQAFNSYCKDKQTFQIDDCEQDRLESQLPVERIVETVAEQAPCETGFHPGTFICNYLYFRVLQAGFPAIFVHLPLTETVPLKQQVSAVENIKQLLEDS